MGSCMVDIISKEEIALKKFGYVMAPKVLVSNQLKVRFMYREKPDNMNDSGWRLFSGYEDQEYVDNPNNIAIYDVNTILSFDRSVKIQIRNLFHQLVLAFQIRIRWWYDGVTQALHKE